MSVPSATVRAWTPICGWTGRRRRPAVRTGRCGSGIPGCSRPMHGRPRSRAAEGAGCPAAADRGAVVRDHAGPQLRPPDDRRTGHRHTGRRSAGRRSWPVVRELRRGFLRQAGGHGTRGHPARDGGPADPCRCLRPVRGAPGPLCASGGALRRAFHRAGRCGARALQVGAALPQGTAAGGRGRRCAGHRGPRRPPRRAVTAIRRTPTGTSASAPDAPLPPCRRKRRAGGVPTPPGRGGRRLLAVL